MTAADTDGESTGVEPLKPEGDCAAVLPEPAESKVALSNGFEGGGGIDM